MPKVDPETHEPVSDDPDGPLDERGGKQAGDPGMEGATETGGTSVLNRPSGDPDDGTSQLPAEKGSDT